MPSVGTLYSIANQLELVVDDLFRDAGSGPKGGGERAKATEDAPDPVQRPRNRKTIRLAEGVRWERLTPRPDPEIEFLFVVYEAGAESCDKDSLIRHGGKEYRLHDQRPARRQGGIRRVRAWTGRFDHLRCADAAPALDGRQEAGRGDLGRVQPARGQPNQEPLVTTPILEPQRPQIPIVSRRRAYGG